LADAHLPQVQSAGWIWLERFAKPWFFHAARAINVDRHSTGASRWSILIQRVCCIINETENLILWLMALWRMRGRCRVKGDRVTSMSDSRRSICWMVR